MIRRPARTGLLNMDDIMMTPTPTELEIFAVAVGFLITGSFMRYVWKSPAQRRARKRPMSKD